MLALCFYLPMAVHAQTGIQGTVTDAGSGEPLIGATVFIIETEQGTTTDFEGDFELTGMDPGTYTVRISFIGYNEFRQSVNVTSGQMTMLNVELSLSAVGLDELVVTGYGIRERREVTGAISSVRAEQIRDRAIQTPEQALQGRSAGFQMVGSSGQPGTAANIRIRGTGSINAGNNPLYIVDGVPLEDFFRSDIGTTNSSILLGLNPADIESIDVLRDAEATSIYGAQGANGVILITTTRGEQGPTQFTINASGGVSQLHTSYDLMTGPEYALFMQEAAVNRALDLGNDPEAARQSAINSFGDPDEVGTFDWLDAVTQTGSNQRYNLSARGGTETTRFFISGGYQNTQGTTVGSWSDRFSLRTNIDHDATERLSFSANVNLSRAQIDGQIESGGNFIASPFHGAVTNRPTTPIFNEDGTYNQNIPAIGYNVLQVLREEERLGREYQVIGNLATTFNYNQNLAFRAQLNSDIRLSIDRRYANPSIPRYQTLWGGRVFERTRETQNYSGNLVADYINTFDTVHNVSAIAGVEYRVRDYRFHSATGDDIPNALLGQLNLAGTASAIAGRATQYKTAGAFSRLQYNYDQRYFTSFNLRYDGHSRFGIDTRWGLFYSGAFAWDAAREDFMRDIDWINQMRLRLSHGITGNANIGDFASRALFGSGGTYGGSVGLRPTQLANANLGWEQQRSTDIAVDFALFQDRVYGSFGVYRNDNEDLHLARFLPSDSGFGSIIENVGSVRNEGLEIEMGAVVFSRGNFVWSSEFNITFPRSEVLELDLDQDWMDDPNIAASRITVGEQRHQWWVRNYAGVNPADGRAMFYDREGNLTYSVGGDDFFAAGSIEPDYFGGWSNQFSYGPVSVDIFFQYEFGSRILDEQHSNFHLAPHRGRNLSTEMFRRWQQPGDITDIPKAYSVGSFPGGTGHNLFSDRRLYDGSYIRLKSINIGYALPVNLTTQLGLQMVTVYARAENLITWTEYPGLDPEVFDRGQTFYPQPRTLEFGAEIRF